MLRRFGVPFNTLTCVNRFNASRPLDVYRFLRRELGSTYLQFIPIVEIKGFETTAPQHVGPGAPAASSAVRKRTRTIRTPWSRPGPSIPTSTAIFSPRCGTSGSRATSARCWSTSARRWSSSTWACRRRSASTREICGKGVAIEHDGSVYACDHYVYPEYRLGNVKERSLGDMVFSPTQVKFGYAKSETLPAYCRQCEYLTRLLGRVPEEPPAAHARRRTGPQLPVPGTQAVLRARGARRGEDGRTVARGAGFGATADVSQLDSATNNGFSGRFQPPLIASPE